MIFVLDVVERKKKQQNGLLHPKKEREKYLKDYKIECEECDEITYVAFYKEPKYCPNCGRRAEAEEVEEHE